jgi:hypothetical protein
MADFPTDLSAVEDNVTDVLAKHVNNLEGKVGVNDSAVSTSLDSMVKTGWIPASEEWTYASSDDPTYTLTITGNVTSKYWPGMRIKLTDSGTQYFIITKVAYSDPNTTLTLYGGANYNLSTGAITNPFYSRIKAPQGFSIDPANWTEALSDTSNRAQTTPTENTWYNPGSLSLTIPIGVWKVEWTAVMDFAKGTAGIVQVTTLSTANNSESDTDFSARKQSSVDTEIWESASRGKNLSLAAKTVYYLNCRTLVASHTSIGFRGDQIPTKIIAVSAFL